MNDIPARTTVANIGRLHTLYIALLLWAFSSSFVAYAQSTFLGSVVPEQYVGLLFTLAAAVLLAALLSIGSITARFGQRTTTIILLVLLFASLLLLVVGAHAAWSAAIIIPAFLVYGAANMLVFVGIDMLVEMYSTDGATGQIRGAQLTIMNAGIALAPLATGFILETFGFSLLFLIAFAFLIPLPLILLIGIPADRANAGAASKASFMQTIRTVLAHRALSSIFFIQLLLRFFYVWMVIYMPLHLLAIGFGWVEIGKIFTIMLLPFVLFEYPAGKLADTRFGEKELLVLGLLIMSFATMGLSFLATPNLGRWALLLFVTRIGASIVEVMTETYFFKQVSGSDGRLIELFRTAIPLSYIIAPILASLLLLVVPMQSLFLILGILMLFAVPVTLRLKDTK